jgi:hypothetical protein
MSAKTVRVDFDLSMLDDTNELTKWLFEVMTEADRGLFSGESGVLLVALLHLGKKLEKIDQVLELIADRMPAK